MIGSKNILQIWNAHQILLLTFKLPLFKRPPSEYKTTKLQQFPTKIILYFVFLHARRRTVTKQLC